MVSLRASVIALGFLIAGCAGHEARVESALAALDVGRNERAIAALDKSVGTLPAGDRPRLEGDVALLVLDRATVLQAEQRFEASQRDFVAADQSIDRLDLSHRSVHDVGRFLFSDDTGPYRAPAYEKLLLNSLNMVNYLARRDLEGARVEARRIDVTRRYLEDAREPAVPFGLGGWLAGFAFEQSGRFEEALRHYEDAQRIGGFESLVEPVRELKQGTTRGANGELLVVIGYGRVPRKIPVRMPIGLAMAMVADDLSPFDRERASRIAAKGLVTWLNLPRLDDPGPELPPPELLVDGEARPLELGADVEHEARVEWQRNERTIVLAALTRTLARFAASSGIEAATHAASGKKSGLGGLLAGLAAGAALTAADTPDTRSWVTLPARVAVARLRLPVGVHHVHVRARGIQRMVDVDLPAGGWSVVVAHALR